MTSATVRLEAAPSNAATFLFALGPRRVVVGFVRLIADRIENGGCRRRPMRSRRAGSTPACFAP